MTDDRARSDRRRRLGDRLQPPGARRGGRARRAGRRRRARVRGPRRARRSTGRRSRGSTTILVPGGDDATLAETLAAVEPDAVVLAGYLRLVGPRGARRVRRPDPQRPPVAAAGVPGAARRARRARRRRRRDGGHGPPRRRDPRRRADRRPGGRPGAAGRRRGDAPRADPPRRAPAAAARRSRASSPARCRCRRAPAARASTRPPSTPRVPVPRRALLSVSRQGRASRSSAAASSRAAGSWSAPAAPRARSARPGSRSPTSPPSRASPRCSTAGSRRSTRGSTAGSSPTAGAPTTARRSSPPGIAPFDLVVVNLYPFAEAARQARALTFDELVEEIDIGGPSMVRAAAKNHASVAIVTSPARYAAILEALDAHGDDPARAPLRAGGRGVPPHGRLRRPDRRRAAVPDAGRGDRPAAGARPARRRATRTRRCSPSRSRRSTRCATARTRTSRRPATGARTASRAPSDGPFAAGEPPLQGKALSYNNVLDASAAAALGRLLRGPAVVIVKHTNPCGAAERPTLLEAWDAALAGDPVSAFGGVVAITGTGGPRAGGAPDLDLPRGRRRARRSTTAALEVLATKPNLRLVVDPRARRRRRPVRAHAAACSPSTTSARPHGRRRGPRHGARHAPRRPGGLDLPHAAARRRTRAARPRPRLAPVPRRRVERDPARPRRDARRAGLRAGQPGRRLPQRGRQGAPVPGRGGRDGAPSPASDAFFPFPDGPQLLLDAGVTAIVQPGGSMRDAEVLACVEQAGGAMLVTGTPPLPPLTRAALTAAHRGA